MKIVVFKLNKKRIGVTIIIIALMLIMFGMQSKFSEKIKLTSLVQSNIKSLKEYKALNSYLTYKLPEDWTANEEKFSGEEILYHNNFQSKDLKVHGFIEVWNLREDLEKFLKRSKEVSSKQNIIKDYNLVTTRLVGKTAYIIDYTIVNSNNKAFKSYEYFIKDDDKFTRFSFFVQDNNFKENMPTIFKSIVQTLSYNNK
ncbi:hypothetical protein [Clostridium rectalis]|uniref:hypothetical protein n=1 Tax=Clostridium rectalis TaxID=2040295 RepID=UPI0019CF8690|nr:hypothetical protein [Clostridium rectalis]